MSPVTVVTPTLPHRAPMLAEAIQSVAAQTVPPAAHLIDVDLHRAGIPDMVNRLVDRVETEWFLLLCDDDLLYPHHLETLAAYCAAADVVYSYCDVSGRSWNPNRGFVAEDLIHGNYIPSNALVRTALWRALGGYRRTDRFEDWDFWVRAVEAGARFTCVPEATWLYRFGDWGNVSLTGVPT